MTDASSIADVIRSVQSGCERSRFAMDLFLMMMLLADTQGKVGPYVTIDGQTYPIVEGLARLLHDPEAHQSKTNRAQGRIRGEVRLEAEAKGERLTDEELEKKVLSVYEERALKSRMANVSRTITEMTSLKLVDRHYVGRNPGDWHPNRGGERIAVFYLTKKVLDRLTSSPAIRQYNMHTHAQHTPQATA